MTALDEVAGQLITGIEVGDPDVHVDGMARHGSHLHHRQASRLQALPDDLPGSPKQHHGGRIVLQEIAEQAGLLLLQVLGIPQHDLVALGEQGSAAARQSCHRRRAPPGWGR